MGQYSYDGACILPKGCRIKVRDREVDAGSLKNTMAGGGEEPKPILTNMFKSEKGHISVTFLLITLFVLNFFVIFSNGLKIGITYIFAQIGTFARL